MNARKPWLFKIIIVPLWVLAIILITLHRIFFPSSAPQSTPRQTDIVSADSPGTSNQDRSPVKKETPSQNFSPEELNPILLGLGAAFVSADSAFEDTLSSPEATAIANLIAYLSFPTVIQGLFAIEKEWSKKHDEDSVVPHDSSPQPSGTDIVNITLHMTHGDDLEFPEWLTDPNRLKRYIDVSIQSSDPIKPVYVIFEQRNGTKAKVYVTEGTQNNAKLDEHLGYLHINPEQK